MEGQETFYVDGLFEVSMIEKQNYVCKGKYEKKIEECGWNFLQLKTNPFYDALEQRKAAGFLQGYLTYEQIYHAYCNFHDSIIKAPHLHIKILNYMHRQLDYLQDMILTHPNDLFWQYAEAFLEQLRFMYKGYLTRVVEQEKWDFSLTFDQFYCLTFVGDLQDLIPAFHDRNQMGPIGNCNGYVRLNEGEIWVAQSIHNIYPFLLRIFKTYHFPTQDSRVGSQWLSFSSRPGDLISKDDFYVCSSGLRVIETSFNNFKEENYKLLSPQTVPCWLRASIATNLSRNAEQWSRYFLHERSGTHNNQWIIIDSLKFPNPQTILFVEEGYDQYAITNMTNTFINQGYIGSYNVPYDPSIFEKMGYNKHGYNYENDPRALIFKEYHKKMINVNQMKKWLILNEEENQRVGLAPRYDLSSNPEPFGLTDCKIIGKSTPFYLISGPSQSNGRFPAFSWEDWPKTPHNGMPNKWNFPWIEYTPQMI